MKMFVALSPLNGVRPRKIPKIEALVYEHSLYNDTDFLFGDMIRTLLLENVIL